MNRRVRSSNRSVNLRNTVLVGALAATVLACGASKPAAAPARAASGFQVVAHGPCGRLSIASAGTRRFIVYGDTGYDLRDWSAGDRLPAAESIVEVRAGGFARNVAWLSGLPTNSGGYVAADLELGGRPDGGAFLLAITSKYAPRPRGALFTREAKAYVFEGTRWAPSSESEAVVYPERAASLPPLPIDTMCGKPELHFERATSTTLASGHVFVAGRCQDRSHINTTDTTVLVAHGAPHAASWSIARAPDVNPLDGIVNLGLFARSEREVYLVAWEPFKPADRRQPYLARFDGSAWSQVETGVSGGLMSLSGAKTGPLYLATGNALYTAGRAEGPWTEAKLPPTEGERGASAKTPPWVHTVRAFAVDDVWVEATYRVKLPPTEGERGGAEEARAGVLFHLGAALPTLYCDAREPAEQALSIVEAP